MLTNPELEDKYCFVYCGPELCNCKRGNMNTWTDKQFDLEIAYLRKKGNNIMTDNEMITISKKEYDRLVTRDKDLSRLQANGVDNWEGYSLGLDEDDDDWENDVN